MGDAQIPALEHANQQTNLWLKRIAAEHHLEKRHDAYSALRAVLHALRDRLTPEQAVHFGAQLPIVIRGVYYEGWRIAGKPIDDKHVDEFVQRVAAELPPQFPRDALAMTRAVFQLLFEELDPGETAKIIDTLPAPLKALWPPAARR
ncbi:DUF2267 domain-containing protein [Methylocella tundrae]|uniref:DUF2267 domain-containing protein n=1 Tax=Methylocella tundrae TaxID=227605 RepID=A0A4V6IMY7_METTU|nr:DUF2267 domain-containing protein [Methylocella tundrae]WPP03816.1 DUF2267 domain-containing protein [Methylocella tundrae]VFU09992.1 conserved protein of unknown function [Methylocella tundrae]